MHVTLICLPGDPRNEAAKDYLRRIPNLTISAATSAKRTNDKVPDEALPCAEIDSVRAEGLMAIIQMVDSELQRQKEEETKVQLREKEAREDRARQMRAGRYPARTQMATA